MSRIENLKQCLTQSRIFSLNATSSHSPSLGWLCYRKFILISSHSFGFSLSPSRSISLSRPVHPQRKMYFGISINSKIRSSKKMLLVVLLWTLDISAVNKKNFRLFAREKKSADIGGGKKKPRHFCGVRNTPNGIL